MRIRRKLAKKMKVRIEKRTIQGKVCFVICSRKFRKPVTSGRVQAFPNIPVEDDEAPRRREK